MADEPVPTNMAEVMVDLKEWMDLFEEAITALSRVTGREAPPMKQTIQGDLLVWAEWFRQHPDVDAAMFEVCSLSLDAAS